MSKHTPGPWHFANGVQIRSDKHQIAKVWMMRGGEGAANARLIAAAPDMLEVLEAVETLVTRDRHDDINIDSLRAVIAKVRGEQ